MRIRKLQSMYAEATGEYGVALELLASILKEEPAYAIGYKRRIAIFKGQNNIDAAVKELTKYLEYWSSDADAWQELAQIYISLTKFELAKFCMEELILLVPENYLYHLQYAELLYTIGGKPDVEAARKYFSQSLLLKPENNLRALFGLAMAIRAQTSSNDSSQELLNLTTAKILKIYKQKDPNLASIVSNALSLSPKITTPTTTIPTSVSPPASSSSASSTPSTDMSDEVD